MKKLLISLLLLPLAAFGQFNLTVNNTGLITGAVTGTQFFTANVTPLSAALASIYQPLDADLTAIAGLSPSNDDIIQRKAGAWVNRSMAQLTTDLSSSFQPLDSDLTAIAALTTTAYGRSFLTLADAAAARTLTVTAGTGVANTFTENQTIIAGDEENATLAIVTDQLDDPEDSWEISALAVNSSLIFANDSTPVLSLFPDGFITVTGQIIGGGGADITGAVRGTTFEVSHASDTTITRVSAGTIAVEGSTILTAATGAALGSANVFTANQSIKNSSGASSLTITGNEAAAASVILSSDDADDLADTWTQSALAGNLLSWTNGGGLGTASMSINLAGTFSVTGTEGSPAQVVLSADENDDSGDQFTLQATGSNTFTITGPSSLWTFGANGSLIAASTGSSANFTTVWGGTGADATLQLSPDANATTKWRLTAPAAGTSVLLGTNSSGSLFSMTSAGDATFTGGVTATSFTGAGTGLTGVALLGSANAFLADQTFKDSSGATTLTVTGNEGTDAGVVLRADDGDDSLDTWNIDSNASGNTLTFENVGGGTITMISDGSINASTLALTGGAATVLGGGNAAVTVIGGEGATASLVLIPDEGDDANDDWTIAAANGGLLVAENSGASLSLASDGLGYTTSGAAYLNAFAGNDSDASLSLTADQDDDATDNWDVVAKASGNSLQFVNNAATRLTLSGAGVVTTTGAIELGHASDTTVARVSAGVVSIEGSNVLTAATGQPLDADLTAMAGLDFSDGAGAAGDWLFPAKTVGGAWSSRRIVPYIQDLVDDPDAAAAQLTLGIGTAGTGTLGGGVNEVPQWAGAFPGSPERFVLAESDNKLTYVEYPEARTIIFANVGTVITARGTGSEYVITDTPNSPINMGGADPVIVIDTAGTYELHANVVLTYVDASFASSETITLKIRRTNNTAADIADTEVTLPTRILTLASIPGMSNAIPLGTYVTTNADDSLTVTASVSAAPSAGTVEVFDVTLTAERIK